MTSSALICSAYQHGRIVLAGIAGLLIGFSELPAQGHISLGEMPGDYSGQFFGLASRSGLRSGWNSIPDTAGSRISELVAITTVCIPVSGDITESATFAVGLEIPYSRKTFTKGGEQEISHSGVGDISITGKYGFTLYSEMTSGWLPHKAKIELIGKIKLPTGRTAGAQDVAHLQSGSGSTDFSLGTAFLTEAGQYFMIHGHAMYRMNTSANAYRMGNTLTYELSCIPAPLALNVEPLGTFLPRLGVMGTHSLRDEMEGQEMINSGSDVLALSFGMLSLWNYVESFGTFWMVEASYQLPILQHVNGVQPGDNPHFIAGIRVFVR